VGINGFFSEIILFPEHAAALNLCENTNHQSRRSI
jgi:hypothetical protein